MVIHHEYPRFDSRGRFSTKNALAVGLPGDMHYMRPSVLLDIMSSLRGQIRSLVGGTSAQPEQDPSPGGTRSPLANGNGCSPPLMIKPSSHHKVAIDIHRNEWP